MQIRFFSRIGRKKGLNWGRVAKKRGAENKRGVKCTHTPFYISVDFNIVHNGAGSPSEPPTILLLSVRLALRGSSGARKKEASKRPRNRPEWEPNDAGNVLRPTPSADGETFSVGCNIGVD